MSLEKLYVIRSITWSMISQGVSGDIRQCNAVRSYRLFTTNISHKASAQP